MTSRQTALMQVLKLVTTILLTAASINVLLLYFTTLEVVVAGCGFMVVYLLKVIYDIEYDRAEAKRNE